MSLTNSPAEFQDIPPDLRELVARLTMSGISVTVPTAKPDDPLPEPLVVRTSLSAAIIEERE